MEGQGMLAMAEYVAFPSYITLQRQPNMASVRITTPRGSSLKLTHRILPLKMRINGSGFSKLCMRPRLREIFTKCMCSVSFVDIDATTTSDWIPIIDQVLLMTSIFLTHMAGVLPVQKPFLPGKNNADDNIPSGNPILTGSAVNKNDRVDSDYALDVVRGKILDYLDAFERGGGFRDCVLQFEEHPAKRPLSLSAIAEGPRIRLLWASFQRIEEEVNRISSSKTADVDNFLEVFSAFIRKASQPVCMAWLKNEPCLRNGDPDKQTIIPLMFEKFREDSNLLQNIKNAGKEDLYAELLHFLSFGSLREGGCFHDHSLFIRHGTSILEDLVVTIADGIACLYLELISVDGNISNDIKGLDLELCSLSTRALQKLRNEVAMNQWLYQNAQAVISMYEDRFDLCTFKSQPSEIAEKSAETFSWWTRLQPRRSETTSCPLQHVMIHHLSLPVKRTQELRALIGWRYYFSLLIELSDITAPLIRAVIDKISSAISFFLVCLIGRSLGLIYTGIRQSLRWK